MFPARARILGTIYALIAGVATAGETPRIAIVIDDLGYDFAAGQRAIALPGPVACAILPGTPRGRALAEFAHANDKEVLLHLPLQAVSDEVAAPGSLVLDMTRNQFSRAFAEHFESVPHVSGVNGHRGSLLTRHPGHMAWLMEEIAERGQLFFLDSYTTEHSVALALARERNLPAVRRDVFLDADVDMIGAEFERLKRLAMRRGHAIGIGHPYPETLAFLEYALPRLEADGFTLVGVRQLLPKTMRTESRSMANSE